MTEPIGGPLIMQAGELRAARIESLRALSVLGVVVTHSMYWATAPSSGSFDRIVMVAGSAGPFLLFVGTGCMLYRPFARRDFGFGGPVRLRRYAMNRAARILPVYYVALVAVLVLQEQGATAQDWLLYATFSQNVAVLPNEQVNRVLWYLVVEVHFYVALPLLAGVIAAVARGSRRRAAAVLGTLALASFGFFQYAWHIDETPDPLWRFSLPAMFMFFAGGMALPLLHLGWNVRRPRWLRGPLARADLWIVLAVALCALVILVGEQPQSTDSVVLFLAFGILLVGACVLPLTPGPLVGALGWRPLACVGVASYSLYLWHDPLLKALARTSWEPVSWPELLAIGLPLSLLVAFTSYALIEAPFLRSRRQWGAGPYRHFQDQKARSDQSVTAAASFRRPRPVIGRRRPPGR